MPQDHWVAQTYLKHFCDSRGSLHAFSKRRGNNFPSTPKGVCCERDGDSNPNFLNSPELLGTYRSIFEPHWNTALEALRDRKASHQDKFVISGYAANLMTCTPGWRMSAAENHANLMTGYLRFQERMHEKYGKVDAELSAGVQALEAGQIKLKTDPDYIKAASTTRLMETALAIYDQEWIVLQNTSVLDFLTSDSPFAFVEEPSASVPTIRFLPLTPKLGLLVTFMQMGDESLNPETIAKKIGEPPKGGLRFGRCDEQAVRRLNTQIVRCADDLVITATHSNAIERFTKRHANFGVVIEYSEYPDGPDSIIQGFHVRIRPTR
ncbi:MAG: DUF4238 domain-containing protein [Alphaproteobacteria bacterium]|nr:DUF4238 domain-containing protein [Alphaproteobacteria bacterium]